MITFTEEANGLWRAVYENGVYLGYAYQEVDGFFYFLMNDRISGFHASHALRQLADFLDWLNDPQDKRKIRYAL